MQDFESYDKLHDIAIGEEEEQPPSEFDLRYWHGVLLAFAWTLFALLQIGSARYLKGTYWRVNLWIHYMCGAGITIITLIFSIWGLVKKRKTGLL